MDQHCAIWGSEYPAEVEARTDDTIEVIGSERVTVSYLLTRDVADMKIGRLSPREKARLTTWLINHTLPGEKPPLVNTEVIDRLKSGQPLSEGERADRLLKYVADETPTVGTPFSFNTIAPGTLAWSESVEESEVGFLVDDLRKKQYLDAQEMQANRRFGTYVVPKNVRVTVDGFEHIRTQIINEGSSQAFVAMWLDDSIKPMFDEAIEPAIREAGYNPMLISQKEHVNKIEDEIIAEIRRSRFVVADFTHNSKQGVRGSVYYEAGFAHGLGLPVIFATRQNQVKKLHFDTSHYSHIAWKSSEGSA